MRMAILDDDEGYAERVGRHRFPSDVEVTIVPPAVDDDHLVEALAGHRVVLGMRERTPFPRELLERLPDLELLLTTGTRNRAFDLDAATEAGVVVCGCPGAGMAAAEQTWALLLGLLRHVAVEDGAVRAGGWGTTLGTGLAGRTMGILGLGRIGSAVARVASAFDMDVLAWSRTLTEERAAASAARAVTMDDLLRRSDVVSIHVPGVRGTEGLVGERELGLMRPTAVLVNTARGSVVDEEALVHALRTGVIAGAALDVFAREPFPAPGLLDLRNVVLSPHRGYVTTENFDAFYAHAVEAVEAFVAGSPIRVLNPDVLAHERPPRG